MYYNPLYDVHYDFPIYFGIPSTVYMLCATPRCGSTYLASLLSQTNTMGSPYEYLADANFQMMQQRFHTTNDLMTMQWIISRRTSSNGVFSFKLHANQFAALNRIRAINNEVKIKRYIYIKRRDTLRQAISWAKAAVSHEWISIDNYAHPNVFDIRSSALDIEGMLHNISQEDSMWSDYFQKNGLTPFLVYYEDILENPQYEVDKIAQWLGMPSGYVDRFQVAMRRQSDESTENILKRFIAGIK